MTKCFALQYFGEPIQCDFKGVDGETAKDYCWIHGSSYIPPQYQRHMKCIADLEGVDRKEDAPDTSYYQWVTFMMLLQASDFFEFFPNNRILTKTDPSRRPGCSCCRRECGAPWRAA